MWSIWKWLGIGALTTVVGVVLVALLREMQPTARRRMRSEPSEPNSLDVDGFEAGRKPAEPIVAPHLVASRPVFGEAETAALSDASDAAAASASTWRKPAIVAGVAVLALLGGLGIVAGRGEAREPSLQARVVDSDGERVILIRGKDFPAGETVAVTLEDGVASTSAEASASGDFMVQIASPAAPPRELKVLAAVAGKKVSAAAQTGGGVLGVSSDYAVTGGSGHYIRKTPTARATVGIQATKTTSGLATATKAATNTATRTAGTATAKPATATATNPAAATATKTQPAAATATKPAASTATPKPATATAVPPTGTPVPGGGVVTFGDTNTNGVDDSSDWLHINGTHVYVPKKGVLKSLSVYVGESPAGKVRLALYKGTATGPTQLVAQTGEGAAVEGWNTLTTTASPIVDVGEYWVAAQTDHANTVYRMAPDGSAQGAIGWKAQAYGPFPATVSGWEGKVEDWSFSMSGTLTTSGGDSATFTSTPTSTPVSLQSTPLPTMSIPETATVAPLPTNTPVPPTATSTSAPAPTPTPGGGTACVTNCGEPRFFCDSGGWAFCDDYRDLYCPSLNFLNDCKFPDMDGVGRHVSVVTYSSSDPYYVPQYEGVPTAAGWFFNQQEHFHSQIEDGAFGVAMQRHHQPFDFAGREGHVTFDVDLKTSARRYIRLILSPELTKSMVDDRAGHARPNNALDIWFINGTFQGHVYQNGAPSCVGGCGNAFSVDYPRYYGTDNVRDTIDVYVRRSHVRILVNGIEYVNQNIPDLGFERAYMYLAQAAYNPCKDGECATNLQIFHWDNVAYDGPVLPDNSLVPTGQQDVIFMAYAQASCTVKGYPAVSNGAPSGYTWVSWVARMPVQAVTPADVSCNNSVDGGTFWDRTGRTPFDFEVVKR